MKNFGKISIEMSPAAGERLQLVSIHSSSPDFQLKGLEQSLPTGIFTTFSSLTIDWECLATSNEESMVVLYFMGFYNGLSVVHPYKVLMIVNY
jgi:hypothetical protein